MAYGRLDVFWPDGKFESYLIDADTTSVGRSSGCTIVLDTDTISRYHFSMTADQEGLLEISDMDSANGTFVDGARLNTSEVRTLRGGEEIQIGHLRMIFHRVDEHPTVPVAAVADETQRFIREDLGFRVESYGPEIAVPPGSHTSVDLTITNDSDEGRRFIVKVNGLPEGWARINRPDLHIDGQDSASVVINIKPFIHSESQPGDYKMQLVVALKDDPEAKIEAVIIIQILPYVGMGMALASKVVTVRNPLRLHLHNQGNVGLPVNLMGRSPDNALRFVFPQAQLVLAPGQRLVVTGDIVPMRKRLLGGTIQRTFHLMVRSRDEASFLAVVPGKYMDSARLPTWAAFGLAALVTGAVALIVIMLLVVSQVVPPPEVTSFYADASSVERGDLLAISWTVTDTDSVNIRVNNELVAADIPADAEQYEINTADFDGEISVVIEAVQGDRMATSSSLVIAIEEPLVIESFVVEPKAMARNVVQTLSGNWVVDGATETRVEGLQALGPVAAETSFGPAGSFEVSGLPSEGFSVILIGTDETGNTVTRSVEITLFDPVCTTTADNMNLYSAPFATSNVVSTLDLGQAIVIDARTEDGNWLRSPLGGINVWGEAKNLRCEESFNPANLYVDPATINLTPDVTATIVPDNVEITPQVTPEATSLATPTEVP